MDNEQLVVPQNSRIDHTTGNEFPEAKNVPVPPACSPVSRTSRLSSRTRSKQNGSTPLGDFKRRYTTPIRSSREDKEIADILKSRLYDGAENSDVYRRQPRPMPYPPSGNVPNTRPTMYRTTLLRKDKVNMKLATPGGTESVQKNSKGDFQVNTAKMLSNVKEREVCQPTTSSSLVTKQQDSTSSLSFGPDQFKGRDVLSVIKHFRGSLNWETDPDVILNEFKEEASKESSNYLRAVETVQKVLYSREDDGQFAYAMLKDAGHPTARYNPYDLVCVRAEHTHELKQLFTVTASQVMQHRKNSDPDLVPMARWLYERRMFCKIFSIPVFAQFRKWKAFTTWKNNVRFSVNTESRQTLVDSLFIVDNILQLSLLKVRRHCENACSSLPQGPASVSFVDEKFTEVLTLHQFSDVCVRRADVVRNQLEVLRSRCLEITMQSCQGVIARYEGLSEWIRSEPTLSATKPSFTQIAQWRAVLVRLSKFVRTVDFMVLELLRRLVVTAASTLLTKLRASSVEKYPWQRDVDETNSPRDESSDCSPPAILTVQLVLGVPESEVDDQTDSSSLDASESLPDVRCSTSHHSLASRASSRMLPPIAMRAFVDLNPDEGEFVSVVRSAISKFEDVVIRFKSLLTDDNVKSFVTPPDADVVYSLTRNRVEEDFTAVEMWPSAQLIFGEDPDYQDTINELLTIIGQEVLHVREFSEAYQQYCTMVDVCRVIDVDSSIKKRTWTHDEFNTVLARHVEQVNAMERMEVSHRVGVFIVEMDSFRDSCLPFPQHVIQRVHHHLPLIAAKANNTLINIIKRFSKNLEKYPESVEEFMERLSLQARVARELPQLEQEYLKVTKLYSLAVLFDVNIHPEEMALYKTLMPSFQYLKSTMLYCEAKKDENIFKFSRDLEVLIGKVRENLVVLKNKVRAPNLIESSSNPAVMLETLRILGEQLEKISTNARNYAVYQDHFSGALSKASRRKAAYSSISSDDATKVDHAGSLQRDVAEVERDLSLRRLLWESSEQWSRVVKTWKEQPFEKLDVDDMQKTVGQLMQTLFLLKKGLPANKVVTTLKREVTSFKQGMPAVTSLRNPALRSRHWEAVQTLMQKRFVRDSKFTLGTLLQMDVFHYKVKIAEISSLASNEYTLEQMLRKVMDFWHRTDFNLTAHNREIAIINGADEIITALEDSLVTLANIKSSRFVAPVKTRVEEYDRKLSLFSLTLEEWLACQRRWLYLESIFSASDIQRQLPNETRLFSQVDKSWKDIMRRTADRPNALRAATAPGVLEILQTCNTQLDKIHRCLEDYLETKRLVFARFYFLSNDELLDILSNSKNPHSIQPRLKKCFSNIRRFGLVQQPPGTFHVHDVMSTEDECVALQKPVKIRGAIESWLSTAEQAILGVVKLYLKQALSRSDQEFTQWVIDHPGQVVLTASQIIFCRNVIGCMTSDDVERSYNALHTRHLSTLGVLVELVMSPLLFYQRLSVEALLTIMVHERDTLQTLMKEHVHDQEDFRWKRQLRYRWNEVNHTCTVLQHNASFEYGFEYLGCSPRLVITPLTDRCYLTLTGALHLHLGGAPFGPAGTGKTETVKDLAKAMGKQCVVFNCSEGLDYKMTGKFFSGVAQSGSWFCFDEFNRIDLEVLSVIAQQLHTIKAAKDLEAAWFVFEGRDIKLSRNCGVFITMNPGYAGRVELPDNVKSLYRPVAMMVPDYVLIAEIILYSEGFLTAMSLSRKVVNLYELISKQLSHQDHYDFGLRSIKSMLLLAGQHKRAAQRSLSEGESVEEHEAGVLLKAIRSTNMPKFVTEDIPLFEQILVDLFHGLTTPSSDERIFQKAIELALEELSLQPCPAQIDKVSFFHENLVSRCGTALVGPTAGGKTTIRKILKEALSVLPILHILEEKYLSSVGDADADITKSVTKMTRKQIISSKYVIGKKASVHVTTINPKCMTLSQLYGEFNSSTMEWTDGLLSVVFRKFSLESNAVAFAASNRIDRKTEESNKITLLENEQSSQKAVKNTAASMPSRLRQPSPWFWLVLDGPVDTVWVENLNTVLDDTKVLCLANGERISMGPGMKLIFEVDNLAKASPATVSRCAIVYVDPGDLGWKPSVKAWLQRIKHECKISQDSCNHLMSLFDYCLDEGLSFQRTHSTQPIQSSDLSMVTTLCNILTAYLHYLHRERNQSSSTPTTSATTTTPITTVHSGTTNTLDTTTTNAFATTNTSGSATTLLTTTVTPVATIVPMTTPTSDNPVTPQTQCFPPATGHSASLFRPMPSQMDSLLSKLFLFAFTWSVGGAFVDPADEKHGSDGTSASDYDFQATAGTDEEGDPRGNAFDQFVRNLFRTHPSLGRFLPAPPHTVFDYFFNLDSEQFVLWQCLVPKPEVLIQKTLTQSIAIADSLALLDDPPPLADDVNVARSLVPTMDTIRYGFLLSLLLLNERSVLLTGEVGVGKTILVEDVLLRLSQELGATTGAGTILGGVLRCGGANMGESLLEVSEGGQDDSQSQSVRYASMQCSARLTPAQIQTLITSKLIKRGRDTLGAQSGSKVLVFIDDFNMPEPDQFGSQPPLELVREYLDRAGFYNTRKLQWIEVEDATIVAACGPPTGGRHVVNSRVLRHFSLLFLPRPSIKSLHRIFHVRLGRHLQGHDFMQEVREMCRDLVFATLSVFFQISSALLPTPAKSHYTFNLKDVTKVIEGLLQAHHLVATTRDNAALLFAHEMTRVFHDRLVDQDDRLFFHKVLADKMDDCLRFRIPAETLRKKPVIFGDFAEVNNPKADRLYRQIKDLNVLSRTLQEYYGRLRSSDKNFNQRFVFFRQAVEHLSRAARVFRQPSGHLLLVGVGGTGKSCVVKLAAYLENCQFKTLRSFSNYNVADFHEDVKCAFFDAGIDGRETILFLNDRRLVKECFFEDITYMLNGGEVPDMFNNEDKERVFLNLRKIAMEKGIPNDKHSVFELFKQRVNQNIHIAVSTTPSGTLFRQRCRVYPSLINCCTIDWYDEWPGEALEAVGNAFLQSTELADSKEDTVYLTHKLTKLSVDVHRTSQEAAARFSAELGRRCYATPSTYIEFIQVFLKIFSEKRTENIQYRKRLRAGILKLDQSHELVGKMEQELVELAPELERKAVDTENLLKQLAKDQESVDQVRHVVAEEEKAMNAEAKRVQDIADDAQKDLDQALPALLAANEELNALDKSDIAEVRVYTKPPTMVMTVTAAVCTLLEEKTDWTNTKLVLADPGFLKRLITYDKDNIGDRVLAKLKRYTTHPNFHPDHVGRISVACRSMCQWVLALDHYAEIFRVVQPKKARCEEAFGALMVAKKNLDQKQSALAQIVEQLQILREQYQASVAELESLHERKRLTMQRLERASVLGKAFSDEHDRWLASVTRLDESSRGLVGDSFLSGATIAYLGAFSQSFRAQITSQWFQSCIQRDIPVSENFDFTKFLTKPMEVQTWLGNSLPHDATSIQSAVLVKNSRKWPLLIDPQQQALKWIAEMEKSNRLKIVKSTDPACLSAIEEAVQLGKPVVISEISERIDPRLESVLQRRTTIRGDQEVLIISGTEVEYNSNFRLYLASPLSNPHFFPEVFNQVTVINFTVTFEGLQDQLLSKVVYEERPGLESRFVSLIENLVSDRGKIRDLEDKCLDLLNTFHGNILDDEELITTLEDSKNTATMIQGKVEQSEAAQNEIRSTRELYLPVASRGAIIFFTLVDLPALDVMYQFSLQWFVDLFVSCILSLKPRDPIEEIEQPRANSPLLGTFQAGTVQPLHRITKRNKANIHALQTTADRTKGISLPSGKDEGRLQAHLEQLIKVITETAYRSVTRGLFARHQITFSFLLCCNILKHAKIGDTGKKKIEKTEWNLFVCGAVTPAFTERMATDKDGASYGSGTKATGAMGIHVSRMAKPPLKWISVSMWQECIQLSSTLPAFSGLCSHIAVNSQYWLDFIKSDDPYQFMASQHHDDGDDDKQAQATDTSHLAWSCSRLTSFQHLMLVKIFRPERLLDAVRVFVKDNLGVAFVSVPPVDLEEIFRDSDPKVPLIFILSPGSDPASQLMRFARDIRGSTCHLDMISLGRGQETRTEETITKAYRHRGRWVFLQNCHLALSFLPRLKELIRKIAEPAVAVEPAFRLWLSSAPHEAFPVSILQAGTKMTVESSPGIKANMLQSFVSVGGAVSATVFEDLNPGPNWKKLLFGLCLFNAVVHERKKFGALGWNIPYDFPDVDLEVSISMLRMLLTEHENVPWQALRYLTAEVTYGGRVTDMWDKRCIVNLVEKFYAPETLDDGYCYSSCKLYRPPSIEMSFSDCCDYIESLPSMDHPELFGMQAEANRFCMQNEAKRLLEYLVLVHPHVDSVVGSGESNDQVVLNLVSDIQKFLPRHIGLLPDDDDVVARQSAGLSNTPSHLTVHSGSFHDVNASASVMDNFLKQEVARFTLLLNVIHASLHSLHQSIRGQVLLSVDIEETYKSLLHNQVPKEWQKVAYSSSKPLASWVSNLAQRIHFFSRWLDATRVPRHPLSARSSYSARSTPSGTGGSDKSIQLTFMTPDMPRAFWISAFFFPQGFFTSVLQRHARVHQVPVDSLTFEYKVTAQAWLAEAESNERDLDVTRVAFQGAVKEDCVRVFGMYLDGALWDCSTACLAECRHGERFSLLPEVTLVPVQISEQLSGVNDSSLRVESYECPVYSTPLRGDSFVLAIPLRSCHPARYWITRGVALVTQLPE